LELVSEFVFAEKLLFDDEPKPANTRMGNKQSLINGINGGLDFKIIERREGSDQKISTDSEQSTNGVIYPINQY
jgi:hypothetical protein